MATIGKRLGEARKKAGLSVADVAHETHIHRNMIYSIEEDDFSKFASVAYAKSFIKNYAEFLKVDLGEGMKALDSIQTLRLGEHELMGEMKKTIKKDRLFQLQRTPRIRRRLDRSSNAPVFLNLILFVLIAAITVFYFLGYKASSPEEARDEIARGLRKANPFSSEGTQESVSSVLERDEETLKDPMEKPVMAEGRNAPVLQRVEIPRENDNSNLSTGSIPIGSGGQIAKPEVNWEIGDPRLSPLASAQGQGSVPAPRETPGIELKEESTDTPVSTESHLPANQVSEEPVAPLRPAGTTPPVSTKREAVESVQGDSQGTTRRAGPVASSE